MSTEPEPLTPSTPEPGPEPAPQNDQPPAEVDPPPTGPDPEEETPPPPPPPDEPGSITITVEPATWYEVTSVCVTSTCVNLNTTTTEPLVYSNAGSIRMVCGPCGQYRPILDHTKLDPQPEMS